MTSEPAEQVVNVLKSFLPADLYALDFTTEYYKKLFDTLKLSDDQKSFELKRGTLIEGIVEFFKLSFQIISVELDYDRCTITKHFLDKTGSETLDRMMHNNAKFLTDIATRNDKYRILPYLLSIPEETREILFKGFFNNNEKADKARVLTRLQMQPIFNLSERDIIFFLRGRIWIRYSMPPKKIIDGQDKRFAGESVEILNALYTKYFPKGMWEDIESILSEVLEEKLNFSLIDNDTFSKTFIPVFRGMIEILLIDVISPEDRYKIEGFTGYVLRQYFDQILLYTAKNLLVFIENRDKNAETFVKKFAENTLIDSIGNKTKTYAIVDSKQQVWNYATILSMLLQYKQIKLRIVTQNNAIASVQEQIKNCDETLMFEKNTLSMQETKLDTIIKNIADSELKNFNSKKGNDPIQAKRHEELLTMKRTEENELYLMKNRIANNTIQFERLQKKIKHEKDAKVILLEQAEPIKETYERIAHALAVVLTKR